MALEDARAICKTLQSLCSGGAETLKYNESYSEKENKVSLHPATRVSLLLWLKVIDIQLSFPLFDVFLLQAVSAQRSSIVFSALFSIPY